MGRAKEIIIKVIPAKIANDFVSKNHYSKSFVQNSKLHFGCFLDNKLHGVLSYGNPQDKRKVINLVCETKWNEMLELNRMAFDDYLPRYSESRCIAISIKMIKKNAPHIKWILSYSNACVCGDGTIYRASGFYLTNILKNQSLREINGQLVAKNYMNKKYYDKSKGINLFDGSKIVEGFQLRYIYLIDKSCKINVPILPFSRIKEMNAQMYKGKKIPANGKDSLSEVVESNANSVLEEQRVTITLTSQNKDNKKQ
jgi:hypothetical protein